MIASALEWLPPDEPNGAIVKYVILFEEVSESESVAPSPNS